MWFMKVGSRVMGPFDEDEMRSKRLCKELAPFHLVSRDGIRWESAAPLIKLLDGAQPEWKRPRPPEPDEGRKSGPDFALAPAVQWYYVDASRNQLGPIPQEALRELLQTRRLSGRALACKVGDTQWDQARRYPELASSLPKGLGRPTIIATSATLCVALVAALVVIIVSLRSSSQGQASGFDFTAPSGPIERARSGENAATGAAFITSLDSKDKRRLEEAVGFVVCGWTVRWKDGDVEEIQLSSGSCFATTPDGYLVTNKHVVEDMIKWVRSDKDHQVARYCNMKVEALEKSIQQIAQLLREAKSMPRKQRPTSMCVRK